MIHVRKRQRNPPVLTVRSPAELARKHKLQRLSVLTAIIILTVLLIPASLIRKERLVRAATADRRITTEVIPARQALRLFILQLIIARQVIPDLTQVEYALILQEGLLENFRRLL